MFIKTNLMLSGSITFNTDHIASIRIAEEGWCVVTMSCGLEYKVSGSYSSFLEKLGALLP